MRRVILIIGLVGLFLANAGEGYAADIEAKLDDNAGASEFVVQDSDATQVVGMSSDGDITLIDTTATVDPWIGLGASAGKIEFDDQATDEINLLNCNVGIGTTSPAYRLVVEAPSAKAYPIHVKTTGATGAGWLFAVPSSGDLIIHEENVGDKVTFQRGGNVGIGTTEPHAALSFGSNLAAQQILLYDSGTVNPFYRGGFGVPGDGSLREFIWSTATVGFTWGTVSVVDGSTFTETMRLTPSGNVGIGTTGPGSALDVKGTLRLSGSTSGYVGLAPAAAAGSTTYTLPSADGSSGQVLSTSGAGVLSWTTAGGGGSSISAGDSNVTVTDAGDGYITFTEDNSEKMRITGGNVGIGTTGPAYKLHAVGTDATSAAFAYQRTSSDIYGPYHYYIKRRSSDAATQTGDFSGGPMWTLRTAGGSDQVYAAIWGIVEDQANAKGGISFLTTTNGSIPGTSNEVMRITQSGKVGIGTTGPGFKLDVQDSAAAQVRIKSSGTDSAVLQLDRGTQGGGSNLVTGNTATAEEWYFGTNYQANTKDFILGISNTWSNRYERIRMTNPGTDTGEVVINDAGSNVDFRVESDTVTGALFVKGSTGDIGIGTTAPGFKLDVVGGSTEEGIRIRSGSGTSYWPLGVYDSSSSFRFGVSGGGNVGIGTTSPSGSTTAGTSILAMGDGTAPAGGRDLMAFLYSDTVGTTTEMFVMDEGGVATQISPHDPETGEWIFYSKNTRTGKVMRVDMERMVRAIERVTGEQFMVERYEAVK